MYVRPKIARLTLVPLLAAGIALSVAPAAQAKRTYCQKWAAADPDKPTYIDLQPVREEES